MEKDFRTSQKVALEHFEKRLVIRLTNPVERNPLSIDVLELLAAALAEIPPNVETVIFTGSGDVFASGANLREIVLVPGATAREYALRGQRLMQQIYDLPISTIAFINGYCFGGALDLALACDRRIAVQQAQFCHPGAKLGIMTGWGGTQRLPRLIGEARALEMFLTARVVGAPEALRIGLIDEITEKGRPF